MLNVHKKNNVEQTKKLIFMLVVIAILNLLRLSMKKKLLSYRKNFKIIIKQCYPIVCYAGKTQKVKIQKLQRQSMEAKCFYHTVWFLVVKSQRARI